MEPDRYMKLTFDSGCHAPSAVCIADGPGNFKLNNYHLTRMKRCYHRPWPSKQKEGLRWFEIAAFTSKHVYRRFGVFFGLALWGFFLTFFLTKPLVIIFRVRLVEPRWRCRTPEKFKPIKAVAGWLGFLFFLFFLLFGCLCLKRNLHTQAKSPYHFSKPAEFTEIHDYLPYSITCALIVIPPDG